MIEETGALYAAFAEGRPSSLNELKVQYADYAAWQREWLQGEVLERQVSYWKEQLAGAPEVLDLPTDRSRPAVQTHRGATQSLTLSSNLSESLRMMSQRNGCTLFMTLLAAFKVLLTRYSGQEDIVVGAPIAGRNRAEIERQIGFFLNILALRTDMSGAPSFEELLRRVRKTALDAYAHQDVPFEMLLQALQPQRDLSRTPVFQVFFNMLNMPGATMELSDIKLSLIESTETDSKFDLTLYIAERREGLLLNLVYNADLFEPERMIEMLDQYEHLLTQVVGNPEKLISEFSLVTAKSEQILPNPKQELSSEWRGAIHTRLSEQARRIPNRLAVIDPQESWTYEELNTRSNQLANYLRSNGVGTGEIVAIYAHRSASVVWAVLGVLKAGAAFLMLDPVYPSSRLIECLHLANPRGWLQMEAAGSLSPELDEFVTELSPNCRLTIPDRSTAAVNGFLKECSTNDPSVEIGPDDMALVAFTSGSTGTPKGIVGRHGPLTHFLPWQQTEFGLNENDRFSMVLGVIARPVTARYVHSAVGGSDDLHSRS